MAIKSRFPNLFAYYFVVGVLIFIFIGTGGGWLYSFVMSNIVDENVKNNQFKRGYICFYDYKSKAASKSQGLYDNRAYFYYFYIDGKKSKNRMRSYFPFREQWNVFIKNMDRRQCYEATYIEAKFLFFTQRRIYQVFDKTVPNPYSKGEN